MSKGVLGILVGGGPAPGINGVISAATIEARNNGLEVIGIYDGYRWLAKGDTTHVRKLDIQDVSRIHLKGGSILRTSRENPTKSKEKMDNVLKALRELNISYLITIGGDDTAFAVKNVCDCAGGSIRVAHVPKTIDNDLPLPQNTSTFGFQTARHVGVQIVQNLMEDSRTTNRWYMVVAMGRKAGHLALGIGKAAGVTNVVIGEEFEKEFVTVKEVCDVIEAAILKRRALGREDGVVIVAEGIAEKLDVEDLKSVPGVQIEYDDYGHILLAEIDLGKLLKREIERRFAERGEKMRIVQKDLGYELRSADPIPFDLSYVRDLGYSAVKFLLSDDPKYRSMKGALVCVIGGLMQPIPFDDLMDPKTGKMAVRMVDIHTETYKVAREYMIRLERKDFDNPELLNKMAQVAKMTVEEFTNRFGYLVGIK